MRRSGRLALLVSASLLVATSLGRPTLCIEADGLVRLESALAADDCCAGQAGDHGIPTPAVSSAPCGCADSDVALSARPIDPMGDAIAPAASGAWLPASAQAPILAAASVLAHGPPSLARGVVLRL